MIEFGEYLPDVAPLDNEGLLIAENVLPSTAGYTSVPDPSPFSDNEIDSRPQGAFSARSTNTAYGVVYTFVGTDDKLYSFDANSFTDVSKGGGYSTAEKESWEFVQWGNTVIATNFDDDIQVITLGSTPFADLGGTPPKARHIATIDNFLVVGNTWDSTDGFQPTRVRWAGINTSTDWAVSPSTQADFQDLRNDAGFVQKVVGGEFGVIFQERAITRMSYIGSPLIFQFDEIESHRGCLAPNSVIKIGNDIAFLSQDGFYIFNGNQTIPIGDGKINRTFFADVDISKLHLMSVDAYPQQNIICWSYASLNADGNLPDRILFFNYSQESKIRWSYAVLEHSLLFSPISTSYTLDGLDAVSTDLDTGIIYSLDDPIWQGSINILATINPDLGLSLFQTGGAQLDATIQTGEAQLSQPDRTYLSLIRPHIDKADGVVSVQIGVRNLEADTYTLGNEYFMNSGGFVPVRANARFMRAQFNMTGFFADAQGFDIQTAAKVGRR